MSHLQFVASFEGYESGDHQGDYDFLIESKGNGSIETLIHECELKTIELPTGLGQSTEMDKSQSFEALKHMQDRSKSIEEAFGKDIEPTCDGIQLQGVFAMLKPAGIYSDQCNCRNFQEAKVEKMAFIYRNGYLMISTLNLEGEWNSDAEKLKEKLEGLTFTQIVGVIGKIMAEIQLSIWLWALLGACALVTSGVGGILCVLAIIGLELISIAFVIAIIEEVTGNPQHISSLMEARENYASGQLASCQENIEMAKKESILALNENLDNKKLGAYLGELLQPREKFAG